MKRIAFCLCLGVILFSISLYSEIISWSFGVVHCLGDSHCGNCFTNKKSWHEFVSQTPEVGINPYDPEFQYERSVYLFFNNDQSMEVPFAIHWLGARTMHRIARDGINVSSYGVNAGDIAVFILGEIDVRVHIGKQVYLKNRDLDDVVQTLAETYVQRIAENQMIHHCRCVICAVTPPSGYSYNLEGNPENIYLPRVPLEERAIFTKLLNKKLSQECAKHHILFLNAFEAFAKQDGSLNNAFSDGCHVTPEFNYMIKDQLISLILSHNL